MWLTDRLQEAYISSLGLLLKVDVEQDDFRSTPSILPDGAFAYLEGTGHQPQDLVEEETWYSVVAIPDDVMFRTSDDYGSQLEVMHEM